MAFALTLLVRVARCPAGVVLVDPAAFCPAGFVLVVFVAFCPAWPVLVAVARDVPLPEVAALVPALDLSPPDLAAPGAAPPEAVSPAAFAGETFTNRMSGRSPGAASSVTGLRMAQARMAWASGR